MIHRHALSLIAALGLAVTFASCDGRTSANTQPAVPGRYVEPGYLFYGEILGEVKGQKRLFVFCDRHAMEEWEASGEVRPPVKSMIGKGPMVDGKRLTVVYAAAQRKNYGSDDETANHDKRVMDKLAERYPAQAAPAAPTTP